MTKTIIPTEKEIMNRVKADWSKPKVTFLCTTYNQQDYISDTIKGFLIQKTSFPYEIIIHDDCSTDDTRKVIDSYKVRYPNLIKTIYQKQNQYSQGVPVTLIAAKQARSDYIALCEGDDYWINESKIENQYKYITSDDTISMIFSPGRILYQGRILKKIDCYYGSQIKQITAQEMLDHHGYLGPTASYLIKTSILINCKELFREAPVGDFFLELYCAAFGKLVYFPEIGSVYRSMAKNSWSANVSKDIGAVRAHVAGMTNAIKLSKTIKEFQHLDWTNKTAAHHAMLARAYLKNGDYPNFRSEITKSYSLKNLGRNQLILYRLRYTPRSALKVSQLLSNLRRV